MDSEHIRAGKLWRSQIIDGIDQCLVHIILLSEHSIFSDNVRRELDLARNKRKPILPISISLGISEISREMQYQLVGLRQIEFDTFMQAGAEEIRKILSI